MQAMCLLAFAWKTHPRWRLLIAGNRDEFHARPTAALARWDEPTASRALFAGRDLQSGGTWMGLRGERAAVVTNVRDPLAPSRPDTTRGSLPLAFLSSDDDAIAHVEHVASRAADFAPFNLLVADEDACVYLGNHPHVEQRVIAPGVHGMSNGGFDVQWPKTRKLVAALEHWLEQPPQRQDGARDAQDFDALWLALGDESTAPDDELPHTGIAPELERKLSATFIRDARYGTRASTILAIDHAGRGLIIERRYGPDGVFLGEAVLHTDD